jgi:hypothetical protein
MKYEVYEGILSTDEFDIFDFISRGRNGEVLKRVAFTQTDLKNVYHLAMGDVVEGGELDDLIFRGISKADCCHLQRI